MRNGKVKRAEKSIHYSNNVKKNKKEKKEKIIAKFEDDLDNRFINDSQLSNLEEQLKNKKLELENIIIEFRPRAAILRSKTKWYDEGEKNTLYGR